MKLSVTKIFWFHDCYHYHHRFFLTIEIRELINISAFQNIHILIFNIFRTKKMNILNNQIFSTEFFCLLLKIHRRLKEELIFNYFKPSSNNLDSKVFTITSNVVLITHHLNSMNQKKLTHWPIHIEILISKYSLAIFRTRKLQTKLENCI